MGSSAPPKLFDRRALSLCYGRHKMGYLNRACAAPVEICMTFHNTAASLIKHGIARLFEVTEGLDLLQMAYTYNLVQFGENAREGVGLSAIVADVVTKPSSRRGGLVWLHPLHTTNFLPEIQPETCTGCGKCVQIWPVEAMTLVSANDPARPKRLHAKLSAEVCLGCGLCVRACSTHSIRLRSRPQRIITPVNSAHKIVMMAIERGKLQNLIFDQQILWSHRALATVFGVILKLPSLKQVLATQQLKSRYLEALLLRALKIAQAI
jgi:ferredoxin